MDIKQSYQSMSTALNSTGRRIHFNMCEWGKESPWQWGDSMAQVTRAAAQQTSATSAPHIVHDGHELLAYVYTNAFKLCFQSWRMSGDHTGNWDSTQSIIAQSAAIPPEYSGRP
jgi:hypothetical protein